MINLKKKKFYLSIVFVFVILIVLIIFLRVTYYNHVFKEIVVEAGIPVNTSDFMKDEKYKGTFTEKSDLIDVVKPGTYTVYVKEGLFVYKSVVTVEDTIKPSAEITEQYTTINKVIEASAFIQNIIDATAVSVQFKETPDYSQYGECNVTIVLTDGGNNQTELKSVLTISPVEVEIIREVGSALPKLEEFLNDKDVEAKFIENLDEIVNMNIVEDYVVDIKIDDKNYTSTLHIVDTTSPIVITHDIIGYHTSNLLPEDFIVSVEDATLTTTEFVKEPDYNSEGISEVSFFVTDESGNVTECMASLQLIDDIEPPVLSGVRNLTLKAGSSISYKKNIQVTDNCDKDISIKIDNTSVNLNKTGSYMITYTATDLAGNKVSANAQVIVVAAGVEGATEAIVNEVADELLEEILTPGMSDYEKAETIFFWVHENVRYVDGAPKENWIKGAYRGLVDHSGDCYVYAMTSKALLTRAGINNKDIEKIPSTTEHYWNLINIGDGWYHFDNTRRKDGFYFFYKTDVEVMEYSDAHHGSHNYDTGIYMDIQ